MLTADLIDSSNYKNWLTPVPERSCPNWADVVKP
jgi:hypothetical protein